MHNLLVLFQVFLKIKAFLDHQVSCCQKLCLVIEALHLLWGELKGGKLRILIEKHTSKAKHLEFKLKGGILVEKYLQCQLYFWPKANIQSFWPTYTCLL